MISEYYFNHEIAQPTSNIKLETHEHHRKHTTVTAEADEVFSADRDEVEKGVAA